MLALKITLGLSFKLAEIVNFAYCESLMTFISNAQYQFCWQLAHNNIMKDGDTGLKQIYEGLSNINHIDSTYHMYIHSCRLATEHIQQHDMFTTMHNIRA